MCDLSKLLRISPVTPSQTTVRAQTICFIHIMYAYIWMVHSYYVLHTVLDLD